jgi:hypothetical protein
MAGGRQDQIEGSWLGGLTRVMHELGLEIERRMDRAPDSGDLLLVLAAATGTRAGRALQALGVSQEAIAREVSQARGADGPSTAELTSALGQAVRAKEAAAAQEDFAAAAELRNEENRLRAALTAAEVTRETIAAIRARLGFDPPEAPNP